MNVLYPFNHLVPNHEGGLEVKFTAPGHENILQRLPVQIYCHYVEIFLTSRIVDSRKAIVNGWIGSSETVQYFGLSK